MHSAPKVRLFFALDIPADARASIAAWRDGFVARRAELRALAPHALHVTLAFLGWRPQERVGQAWEAAVDAVRELPAPTLTPRALVPLPRRRPRLLALELADEDGRAATVHDALGGALAAAGLYEPEARPFWAHVTLARVRARAKLGPLDPPAPPGTAFPAPVVTLYRSDLHASGARYMALEHLELQRLGGERADD